MKPFRILLAVLCAAAFFSCASAPADSAEPSAQAGSYFPALATIAPDATASLPAPTEDWYKDQNFYHIWVSAFSDSDNDGVGDIKGIELKLDYLKDLGVTAIWLSPFCASASSRANLHCYDTIDYYTVDPRLGTNDDVKSLIAAAHARGIRLIFDMVPNHVSDKHPWFQASKSGDPAKRNWFLWKGSVPTAGWKDWGGRSAWRPSGKDASGKAQYYYAIFWSGMPDLNFRNPEVRTAIADASIFWLNMGFDGIRMDAVRYLFEDPKTGVNGIDAIEPETVEFFQRFRADVLDAYGKAGYPKFMVAENWTGDRKQLQDFIEKDGKKAFQMTMDFSFGGNAYQSIGGGPAYYAGKSGLEAYWDEFGEQFQRNGGWLATFLNNHDNYNARPFTQFRGNQDMIDLAAVLQYTGLGTPFWYYGNELDMQGANTGQDTNFRKPTAWDALPAARANRESTFNTIRALMALRSARSSLRRGDFTPVATDTEGVKAFIRADGNEKTLVVMNFTDGPLSAKVTTGLASPQAVVLTGSASSGSTKMRAENGQVLSGELGPYGYAVADLK